METNEILDTSIVFDRTDGIISIFSVIEFPPSAKKNFDVLLPDAKDYVKAIEIADKLREQGTPVSAIDIIIAAMCLNRSARLVTKDTHFQKIQAVCPELSLSNLS